MSVVYAHGTRDWGAADRALGELLSARNARDEVPTLDEHAVRRCVETYLAVAVLRVRLVHCLRRFPQLNDLRSAQTRASDVPSAKATVSDVTSCSAQQMQADICSAINKQSHTPCRRALPFDERRVVDVIHLKNDLRARDV